MSLAEKCEKATYVIDNTGTMEDTKQQVLDIYSKLCKSKLHWRLRIGVLAVVALMSAVVAYLIRWWTKVNIYLSCTCIFFGL